MAKKRKSPTRIDRDRVMELYDRGMGVSAIAREIGCTKGAISKIFKSLGVEVVKQNVAVATRYVSKKNTASDHLMHLANQLREELDWIKKSVPPKTNKEYRDWQDQQIKLAAEMRKLINCIGDISYKIYQAQHTEEVLSIIVEEIGVESRSCQKRIYERLKTQRDILIRLAPESDRIESEGI
jgi:hypothetical protein